MNIEIEDYNGSTKLVLGFPSVTQDDVDNFKAIILRMLPNTGFSFADLETDENNQIFVRLQCDEIEDTAELFTELVTKLICIFH